MTRIQRLPANTKESGQTIVMVALCIVAMLAMAALGIDLATLYTARAEAQRTADAAALAGAQAFVLSGLTSLRSTDTNFTAVQTAAGTLATAQANQVVQANKIAGVAGTASVVVPPTSPNPDGNPQISVTVQRTGLPTFFARVLPSVSALTSVSATAKAEAFNPSFSSANPSGFMPAAAKCVKPFIVPNIDPNRGNGTFLDPTTGALASNAVLGETLTLVSDCQQNGSGCSLINSPPQVCGGNSNPTVQYLPALNTASTPMLCPSCGTGAPTVFEQNISCCNTNTFTCGSSVSGGTSWAVDLTVNPNGSNGPTNSGLQCAIHQNSGRDSIIGGGPPFQITAGNGNPLVSAGVINSGDTITNSSSIMTLAVYDHNQGISPPHVIGFMQVFVVTANANQGNSSCDTKDGGSDDDNGPGGGGGGGRFLVEILNVSGCGTNASTATPVAGGGVSSIPVRLVH